jgi:3-hydroxyisobutyryl-CoA hydrolase
MMRSSRVAHCATVRTQRFAHTQLVELNRPKALNALDLPMVQAMAPVYAELAKAPAKSVLVVLKGCIPKAFCAGGDVVSLVQDEEAGRRFFYHEYQLDHAIGTMPHDQVALWDGIVMGGGVGISVHASHRVCTEATMFAMPETGIGLFPDVGGSYFLPRLRAGGMGMFLALTGARLKGADVLHAGIATHYVARAQLPALEAALCGIAAPADVDAVLGGFTEQPDAGKFTFAPHLPTIEKCFAMNADGVEGIVEKLHADGGEWAAGMAKTMGKMSPLSLKVSYEAQRRGLALDSLTAVLAMEYDIACECLATQEFSRGVTALLIDKTGKPQWQPATLAGVSAGAVDAHFAPHAVAWDPTKPYAAAAKL